MDLSAPMEDRPYLNSTVRPKRNTKRMLGACIGPARSSHVVYQKKLAIGEYRGILSSLDAVVHYYYEQCDTALCIGNIRST